ncbi:hypothetical protein SAV31267_036670 [Streptomyces avermitilis]|uniref:Uncharacterized protein n=1 Tax=Streptomyces avermitilis TaxID=33903 RepID=A0A4D4MPU3_STRAX|nr:hypothetical protein SAVMC3_62260 [Streptomyces avermitilis]GDY74182.1 hypothetical protein SAV31267_036670 [Streptomyces avermitilis]
MAVVAAVAVGAYFVIGSGGGSGLADDGAHKLTTPQTVLSEYKRVGKGGESSSNSTVKDLAESGVKNGKSVVGFYSTADFGNYDPENPSDTSDLPSQSELLTAKGVTMAGGYGTIADPKAALDKFFAALKKNAEESSSGSKSELIGSPESVDLDGAVMKCQSAKSTNSLTKKVSTDWFCAWADYSTIAMVSPGDNTGSVSKDVAADITTKLRDQVRVKA